MIRSPDFLSFVVHRNDHAAGRVNLIEIAWPEGEITQISPRADLRGEITISRR
ncbi:hypothetical protein [Aurantiacibacter marinus]|uniref:hypothetical protein n=1 Tax=Aurantiacibacter marinus TaxID=874156 RepID=UPI0012E035CA|nr:hypothetical protein [Aurantiacibacter marinus]